MNGNTANRIDAIAELIYWLPKYVSVYDAKYVNSPGHATRRILRHPFGYFCLVIALIIMRRITARMNRNAALQSGGASVSPILIPFQVEPQIIHKRI